MILAAFNAYRFSFPRLQRRQVSCPGVARCAGHPCVVHKVPQSPHHKLDKSRTAPLSG